MLTPDEQAELQGLQAKYGPNIGLSGAQTTLQPAQPSLLARTGETIANLPSMAVQDVGNMLGSILQLGTPDEDKVQLNVPKPYDLAPAAKGDYLGETIDTLGGVGAALPSFLLPELAIGKVGEAAGIGGKALTFLKGAGAGAINSLDGTPANTAEQAGLLGTTSLLNLLPRGARVLPSLAAGAAAGGLNYLNGGDAESSLVQGGVFGVLGMLPGQESAPTTRVEERNATGENVTSQPVDSTPIPAQPVPGTGIPNATLGGVGMTPDLIDSMFPQANKSAAESAAVMPGKSAQESADTIFDTSPYDVTSRNILGLNGGPMGPSLNLGNEPLLPTPAASSNLRLVDDTHPELPLQPTTSPAVNQVVGHPELPLVTSQPSATAIPDPSLSGIRIHTPPDAPDREWQPQLPRDKAQIISSAVNPGDGRILVGDNWNDAHDLIGMRHDLTELPDGSIGSVPQEQRGFLVHNADETQEFVDRNAALPIARESGQLIDSTQQTPLQSQDLQVARPEKGSGNQAASQPPARSSEPPPQSKVTPQDLKSDAASGGVQDSSQAKEPWYMTSDLSHLTADQQDDAEYLRNKIRDQVAEHDHEAAAYSVGLLQELTGTKAPDSPQQIVTSQSAVVPKGASWLYDDSVGKPQSREDYLDSGYEEPSFETDTRAAEHQGTLTGDLQTQANDYEVEDDKVGAAEFGTDYEDSDALTKVLEDERSDEVQGKEEAAPTDLEADQSPQITEADRKEFAELTDDAPKSSDDATGKSESDKLMGLLGMLEKNPKSPALRKAVRNRTGLGVKRRGSRAQAGFIDAGVARDALGLLARYSPGLLAGGSVGAYYDDENRLRGFLIGAAAGGALQRFGPGYIKMLMTGVPREIKAAGQVMKDVTSQPGGKIGDLLSNIAAEDFGATGQGMASYIRRFTKAFTMTPDAVDAVGISNLSGIQHEAADAIKLLKPYYGKLSAAERDIYAKYIQEPWYQEDAKGNRVLDASGNPQLNTGVETRFATDMAAHPEFASGAQTARRLIAIQQEMIANGMADGKYKTAILNSIGKYQTDAFRMFMESKYRPSESKINSFLDELQYTKVFPDYDRPMLMKTLQTQLDGIYQNRGLYEGSGTGDSGTFDQILQSKIRMPADLQAKLLAAVPDAKSVDEIVTSQRVLPPDLQDALAKAIRDGKYLTPAYRDLLGYYNDPVEKSVATMMKLMPAAKAAKLFDEIANGTNTKSGLPTSMDPADAVKMRQGLQAQRAVVKDPALLSQIDAKLLDLKQRIKLPDSPNLGKLAGRYVPQGMADILPDMNKGVTGGQGLPITRAILDYNRALKAGQTILNPVSHVKWFYNSPLLAAMSGTGVGWVKDGFRVANGKVGEYMGQPIEVVARRMEALGIKDTNIAHSEFNTTAKQALTGYLDSSLVDKFFSHPVVEWAAQKYGLSDNAVRIGTFLKREQTMLSRFSPDVATGKMSAADAASAAEKEAVRYTNRYTINYAATPGGIAYIRKMPFVSLYLTYSYHMARITKNIMVDATGTGPYGKEAVPGAIAKLAALSVIPAAIQAAGRAMLSPDDQKAWDESIRLDQPYAQPRFRYPLWRNPDGSFKYLDYTAYVPTGDWNMFGRAVMSGDPKQMLAANPIIGTDNTPALNIATEIITGQDSRTGRPINTVGRALDTARQEIAPAFLGGYEFDNLMRALQPNAEGGIGITRLGSGKGYSIGDLLATYLTGLRPTSVNVDWQKHTAVQDAQSQIATEKQFLMDTARSDATQEVKDAATKRYADAVKLIVAHLQWKLGMENN